MSNADTATTSVQLPSGEVALITTIATVNYNLSVALHYAPRGVTARCAACSARVLRIATAQCVAAALDLPWITGAHETVTARREQPTDGTRCPACATFVRGWGRAADVLAPHRAMHNNTSGCVAPNATHRKWIADMLREGATVFHVRTDSISDGYAVRYTATDCTQLTDAVRVAFLAALQTDGSREILAACDVDNQLAQALRHRAGITTRSALGWICDH